MNTWSWPIGTPLTQEDVSKSDGWISDITKITTSREIRMIRFTEGNGKNYADKPTVGPLGKFRLESFWHNLEKIVIIKMKPRKFVRIGYITLWPSNRIVKVKVKRCLNVPYSMFSIKSLENFRFDTTWVGFPLLNFTNHGRPQKRVNWKDYLKNMLKRNVG